MTVPTVLRKKEKKILITLNYLKMNSPTTRLGAVRCDLRVAPGP